MADRTSEVIFLPPGGGRSYQAGPMHAVFKGRRRRDRRSLLRLGVVARGRGHGAGSALPRENVELFYVLEGTMTFLAGERWFDARAGSFLRIPAGVRHDFENRGTVRAGALNVFVPGGFEAMMPAIVDYFAE